MNLDELALWPHQRDAVERTLGFLGQPADGRAVLIHHPTGAGKTGIMAAVGRVRAAMKPVLVVCPSAALVGQLETQFKAAFWDRIGAPEGWRFEHTARLTITRVGQGEGCNRGGGGRGGGRLRHHSGGAADSRARRGVSEALRGLRHGLLRRGPS